MSFSFIQITDHHLPAGETRYKLGYAPWHAFRATVRALAAQHAAAADFLVCTGDLVDAGTDEEYAFARGALGLTARSAPPGPQAITFEGLRGMPAYFLPGNHDPRAQFFRHMFDAPAGTALMNAAFVHKGVQFVCLDFGAENKAVVFPQTLAFLRERLAGGAPTVVLTHHQLVPCGIARLDGFLPDDPGPIADALSGGNVLGVFCGHFHLSYEGALGGVPVYGTRSTMFSFAAGGDKMYYVIGNTEYRIVTVDGAHLHTETVSVPL